MNNLEGKQIGIIFTGSFCTYKKAFAQLEKLKEQGCDVFTIFSDRAASINSRFGKGNDFVVEAEKITGNKPILTIEDAEPIGPRKCFDIMAIFPCTGNTVAKLCNGIIDSPALMAAKAHLRNELPLVIAISTNDGLGMNMKNIGMLMNTKNVYFVPFGQDDPIKKPNSLVAHTNLLIPTICEALNRKQIQPVVISPFS